TGAIGALGNPIQFAGDPNPLEQIVSIGTVQRPAAAVFLSGLGTLTLGSVLLNSADLSVTAAGNLDVIAGGLVQTTSTSASAITLQAADLDIQGLVEAAGAGGGIVIRSSAPNRAMSVGGEDNAVVGINLTDSELARLVTTSSGTITFGDTSQT